MKQVTVSLLGNPNCGKSTLFNALTGAFQRVGNWSGVTVERKSGFFKQQDTQVEVVDLPGAYSLVMASETSSIDEKIVCDYILNAKPDVIVNILDASNLERNLYLTLQLLEMQVPMIVVLNMMDVARQRKIVIDINTLQKALGCPVIAIEAHRNKGIKELKQAIVDFRRVPISIPTLDIMHPVVSGVIASLAAELEAQNKTWLALRLLEADVFAQHCVAADIHQRVVEYQKQIQSAVGEDADILLADARYRFISQLISQCLTKSSRSFRTWTARMDSIVLNRVLGIPIFLAVMYLMFLFAINVGGAFQDFFDIASDTVFVGGLAHWLMGVGAPAWLTALLADGVGRGVNTTLTFIPVLGAMFLFLSFLEDSGYMARAAFVVDRGMRALGLPGKSFVPMIVGFGCNVPAVMATRILENKRDRILTVMMSPFMSCGARLAIYAVFTAAFFPIGGQNVVFALYLTGIVMAMLTGLLLRKTVLKGEPAPLVMELPPYHVPRIRTLCLRAWQRLKSFVFRAGKFIVPICILLGILSSVNIDGSLNASNGDAHSLLSVVGRLFTPIFAPMGIQQDNWPATVGLVTGVLAKEVVIGTLNTLYSQVGHLASLQASGFDFWGGLQTALSSIPHNLARLSGSLGNPVLAQVPVHTLDQNVYGEIVKRFDGQVGAIAYLLFVLLYFPCVSTTAAMLREMSRAWTVFSVLWTTGLAYCVAVFFYQAATYARHPIASLVWIVGIVSVLSVIIFAARIYAGKQRKRLTLLPSGEVI